MSTAGAPVVLTEATRPNGSADEHGSALTGTGALLRLALRRDRVLLPSWILGLSGMAAFSAQATIGLYPDLPQRIQAAEVVNGSAALIALYGRIYDPTSLGELSLFKLTAFVAALIGVLFAWIVVRHTRADEEAGRLELVGSAVVGRAAPLAAAMWVALIGATGLAVCTGLGLTWAGLPMAGSMAFGAAWGATALLFGAVGAVAAQLTTTARAATGLSMIVLAVAYLLRAVGDLGEHAPGVLSWLSPIGWTQQVRAFSGTRWHILALPLLATAILVPVAFWLRSRRDLGAGLLADRAGPERGRIDSALGLAARLQRPAFLGWAAGVLVMGTALGSVADSVSGFLDSPAMQDILEALGGEQAIVDTFLSAELGMVGGIIAAYGLVAVGWLHAEETEARAEVVLTAGTSRPAWVLSHVALAMLGVAALVVFLGLAIGTGYALVVGDLGQVPRMVVAALTRIPAAWVMLALAAAIWALWPRAASLVWALYVAFLALGEFGVLWGVPDWVMNLSPFRHSPVVPGLDPSYAALPVLVLVAAGLVALAVWAFSRRDVATG